MMAVYDPKYDLNKDGKIDQLDMDILTTYYGMVVDPSDPMSVASDFNNDGIINVLDYGALVEHLGAVRGGDSSILLVTGGVLAAFVGLLALAKNR
jgi:hypothetical protein